MKKLFIFVLGAAAGSLVTWKLVEEKYKRLADEEIESVKEYYDNKLKTNIEITPEGITMKDENNNEILSFKNDKIECANVKIEEYKEQLDDLGYTVETKQPEAYTPPYVISPEEFGEFGNEMKSLTYYADDVLADDDDDIISDPESVVGDALQHFGEYEDDCVHVRDERIECDYEILRSEKTFGEVYKEEN